MPKKKKNYYEKRNLVRRIGEKFFSNDDASTSNKSAKEARWKPKLQAKFRRLDGEAYEPGLYEVPNFSIDNESFNYEKEDFSYDVKQNDFVHDQQISSKKKQDLGKIRIKPSARDLHNSPKRCVGTAAFKKQKTGTLLNSSMDPFNAGGPFDFGTFAAAKSCDESERSHNTASFAAAETVSSDPTNYFVRKPEPKKSFKLTQGNLAAMAALAAESGAELAQSQGIENINPRSKFYQFTIDEDKESTVILPVGFEDESTQQESDEEDVEESYFRKGTSSKTESFSTPDRSFDFDVGNRREFGKANDPMPSSIRKGTPSKNDPFSMRGNDVGDREFGKVNDSMSSSIRKGTPSKKDPFSMRDSDVGDREFGMAKDPMPSSIRKATPSKKDPFSMPGNRDVGNRLEFGMANDPMPSSIRKATPSKKDPFSMPGNRDVGNRLEFGMANDPMPSLIRKGTPSKNDPFLMPGDRDVGNRLEFGMANDPLPSSVFDNKMVSPPSQKKSSRRDNLAKQSELVDRSMKERGNKRDEYHREPKNVDRFSFSTASLSQTEPTMMQRMSDPPGQKKMTAMSPLAQTNKIKDTMTRAEFEQFTKKAMSPLIHSKTGNDRTSPAQSPPLSNVRLDTKSQSRPDPSSLPKKNTNEFLADSRHGSSRHLATPPRHNKPPTVKKSNNITTNQDQSDFDANRSKFEHLVRSNQTYPSPQPGRPPRGLQHVTQNTPSPQRSRLDEGPWTQPRPKTGESRFPLSPLNNARQPPNSESRIPLEKKKNRFSPADGHQSPENGWFSQEGKTKLEKKKLDFSEDNVVGMRRGSYKQRMNDENLLESTTDGFYNQDFIPHHDGQRFPKPVESAYHDSAEQYSSRHMSVQRAPEGEYDDPDDPARRYSSKGRTPQRAPEGEYEDPEILYSGKDRISQRAPEGDLHDPTRSFSSKKRVSQQAPQYIREKRTSLLDDEESTDYSSEDDDEFDAELMMGAGVGAMGRHVPGQGNNAATAKYFGMQQHQRQQLNPTRRTSDGSRSHTRRISNESSSFRRTSSSSGSRSIGSLSMSASSGSASMPKPTGLPNNAIVASMLFRTSHNIDADAVDAKLKFKDAENSKFENGRGDVPSSIHAHEDTYSSVSSFSEESSFRDALRKPSKDLLDYFSSTRTNGPPAVDTYGRGGRTDYLDDKLFEA